MNKIFFTIFITIFLSHCGFSPIYVGNPKEIVVSKSEIIGDKNLAFDLERKFRFLKNMSNSERQIIYQRTGLLLAELDFISTNNNVSIEYGIDLAFSETCLREI